MAFNKISAAWALLLLAFGTACSPGYQVQKVAYQDYRIKQTATQPAVAALMKPYADSVNKSMNNVLGTVAIELEKRQPEGSLGNFLVDGMLAMSTKHYGTKVDAAFMNYGGIRLNSIPAGAITQGKVFEILPFDNTIVLQKVSGKVLQQFVNHVAGRGGWPSAGIRYQIKNKTAINITVGGAPLDEMAIYTIANNDYVANGGDDCNMLRNIAQQTDGYLVRTAIIEYVQGLTAKGQPITGKIENRVSNAE